MTYDQIRNIVQQNENSLHSHLIERKESVHGNQVEDESENGDDDDEDDGVEMPEDLVDLPHDQQQKWIIFRSLSQMIFGAAIVMIFSDPMVSTFDAMGDAIKVDSF